MAGNEEISGVNSGNVTSDALLKFRQRLFTRLSTAPDRTADQLPATVSKPDTKKQLSRRELFLGLAASNDPALAPNPAETAYVSDITAVSSAPRKHASVPTESINLQSNLATLFDRLSDTLDQSHPNRRTVLAIMSALFASITMTSTVLSQDEVYLPIIESPDPLTNLLASIYNSETQPSRQAALIRTLQEMEQVIRDIQADNLLIPGDFPQTPRPALAPLADYISNILKALNPADNATQVGFADFANSDFYTVAARIENGPNTLLTTLGPTLKAVMGHSPAADINLETEYATILADKANPWNLQFVLNPEEFVQYSNVIINLIRTFEQKTGQTLPTPVPELHAWTKSWVITNNLSYIFEYSFSLNNDSQFNTMLADQTFADALGTYLGLIANRSALNPQEIRNFRDVLKTQNSILTQSALAIF